MKIISILGLCLIMAGCQTTNTRVLPTVNFQKIDIPSQFLDCDGKKIPIPDPKNLTNKQISRYVLKMTEILEECQSDVASIKTIIEQYNIEVDKINERSKNDKVQ